MQLKTHCVQTNTSAVEFELITYHKLIIPIEKLKLQRDSASKRDP